MIETKSTWPYIDIFRQYKSDINIFVETGMAAGDSIQDAVRLGFTKILSIDIVNEMVDRCAVKFADEIQTGQVLLFRGDSRVVFPSMLEYVKERAMFWLDSHQDASHTLFEELEFIRKHYIKNHVIIIDDIPLYFDEVGKLNLKWKILNINPNYKFSFNSMHGYDQYQMIAYE